ncbi:MAG: hypothetical protein J7L14_00105 [Candidatus Diapherotrites archaeon]|nr:hypothetical protein [Candidatus Diapherotrites archaeon]
MRGQISIDLLVAALAFIVFLVTIGNLFNVLDANFQEFSKQAELRTIAIRTVALLNALEQSDSFSYNFIPAATSNCTINVTHNNTKISTSENGKTISVEIPLGSDITLSNSCNQTISG